ncbi:MAG: hypothetical protein AB8F34_09175 [Akkermansiaceae bacterium]
MKTKLLTFVSAAIALFGLNSCLQVESTISVNKDGSGVVTETTMFGDQMKMMIEMAAAQGGANAKNPLTKMMDKGKAEARAKKMGEGVELVSLEKIDADGKVGMKTVYKFSDINKLTYSPSSAIDMGNAPGGAAEKAKDGGLTFKFAEGKLTIIQKKPDAPENGGDGDEVPEMDPQMLAMMQGMMKDMRITTKVKIEPGIAVTDASHVNGNVITLGDIQMGKIMAHPEKLKALQSGDFDKAKAALKGVEGVTFEDKESISVQMK